MDSLFCYVEPTCGNKHAPLICLIFTVVHRQGVFGVVLIDKFTLLTLKKVRGPFTRDQEFVLVRNWINDVRKKDAQVVFIVENNMSDEVHFWKEQVEVQFFGKCLTYHRWNGQVGFQVTSKGHFAEYSFMLFAGAFSCAPSVDAAVQRDIRHFHREMLNATDSKKDVHYKWHLDLIEAFTAVTELYTHEKSYTLTFKVNK